MINTPNDSNRMAEPVPMGHRLDAHGLTALLSIRAGIPVVEEWMPEKEKTAINKCVDIVRSMANEPFSRIMTRVLQAVDPHYAVHRVTALDGVRDALEVGAVANTFGHVFGVSLLRGFMAETDSTLGWASDDPVSTFKLQDRLRLETGEALDSLPRGKQAKQFHPRFWDSSYRVLRYARSAKIDDVDMIDGDSTNIFTLIPIELGKMARRCRPDLVYSELLLNPEMPDGVTLFHADHGNYASGAALSETTVEAGMAAMQAQQENGVSLNIKPKYLIVPPALGVTARKIVRAMKTDDPDLDLTVRVEARLQNGVRDPRVPGVVHSGSSTTWYLAASAAQAPSILFGARTDRPQVRSYAITGGGEWGMYHDVNYDCGVLAVAWQGLYRGDA